MRHSYALARGRPSQLNSISNRVARDRAWRKFSTRRLTGATRPPSFRMILADGRRFWRQDSEVKQTTIFIGDSNAEQYAPRISELVAQKSNGSTDRYFATTGGCSPIPAVFLNAPEECRNRMIQAYLLAETPEVDTVVVGASWILHMDDATKPKYLDSLEQLLRKMAAHRRVFILNIPHWPELDPQNMFRGSSFPSYRHAVYRGAIRFAEISPQLWAALAELKERGIRAGAVVIDPLDSLCTGLQLPCVRFERQTTLQRCVSHAAFLRQLERRLRR